MIVVFGAMKYQKHQQTFNCLAPSFSIGFNPAPNTMEQYGSDQSTGIDALEGKGKPSQLHTHWRWVNVRNSRSILFGELGLGYRLLSRDSIREIRTQ